MARRAFLHIGSPKTGTTFLQQVLWRHRAVLSANGLLLPLPDVSDHHRASLDLRGRDRAADGRSTAGAWPRLVDDARAWDGDVLVSHETLAAADAQQADTAVRAFLDSGFEVHVVITARDLARQLVAHWQQSVKGRHSLTLGAYVAEGLDPDVGHGRYIALVQDHAALARRWGALLPAEQVHVVTVPPPGAPRDLLWQRFAGLLGLAADEFDLEVGGNESLGLEQAELLRRLNAALGDRLPRPGPYPRIVRGVLVGKVLAGRAGTRLSLTDAELAAVRDRSAAQVADLRTLGVDVVGDLDELLVAEPAPGGRVGDSSDVPAERLLEEAVEATVGLLEILHDDRRRHVAERDRLRARLQELERPRRGRRRGTGW